MRVDLLKLKPLSFDTMLSKIKILDNYLTSLPSPDNKSFLQGEMIEIVTIILLVYSIFIVSPQLV